MPQRSNARFSTGPPLHAPVGLTVIALAYFINEKRIIRNAIYDSILTDIGPPKGG